MKRGQPKLIFLLVPFAGLCLIAAYWTTQIDPPMSLSSGRRPETTPPASAAPGRKDAQEPEEAYRPEDQIEFDYAPGLRFGPYSRHDPLADQFSMERAAQFLDKVSLTWGEKYRCVTCHTNGYYMTAPRAIFGNRPAFREVHRRAEKFVDSWDPERLPAPEYVVATASFLAINDVQMGKELGPTTLKALDHAWDLQHPDGHWTDWSKCNWPPYESDDHYGPTLLALAVGMAPGSYAQTERARRGMARIRDYLATHPPTQVHQKAMLLWVARYHDGLVGDVERREWIQELLDLQRPDGGWASGELGNWRQHDGEPSDPPVTVETDGYGTGFVIFVLRQAGIPASDPRLQKGLAWLKTHQRADGHWWSQSLRNEPDTDNFLTHTGTTFALKALAASGFTLRAATQAKP